MGEDGKTGYQRLKGKKYRGDEVEFGERVHYRLKSRARQEKIGVLMGCRLSHG